MAADSAPLTARRRAGRPPKPADQVKRSSLNIHTTRELRRAIEEAAVRSGRTLVGQVEHLLVLGLLAESEIGDAGARDEALRNDIEAVLSRLQRLLHPDVYNAVKAVTQIGLLARSPMVRLSATVEAAIPSFAKKK